MQEKGTEIDKLSACCHASLHLGLNKCRAEHKASPLTALLPPPKAAKADPSLHPSSQGAEVQQGSVLDPAADCAHCS